MIRMNGKYEIKMNQSIKDGYEVVLGYCEKAYSPWVVWYYTPDGSYILGGYHQSKQTALTEYYSRLKC